MEVDRFRTLGLMAHTTAKTIREGDPEVSEAIDAVRYAVRVGIPALHTMVSQATVSPVGTVVIAAPWNFPYAIPTLALASALAAGNRVILKPAPEATAVGAWLVDQCRRAGVPHDAVQLAICTDGPVASRLVSHPAAKSVVLTGSSATASFLLGEYPEMRLQAETSGKNSLIITEAADVDAAIKDLVKSAFGHAGQKCSAASLAIFIGGDRSRQSFTHRLQDAVRSLNVGPATDLSTVMGPLISSPSANLRRALTTLEPGEQWLVQPKQLHAQDDRLWSPGVRVGVKSGSWFHLNECFGPVLGVMFADTLDEAIKLQNATAFGLTGGIHSLDPSEVAHWISKVQVGNAYVNRAITGAVVGRQPFGGWKASSVGGGFKPGGDHYIYNFVQLDMRAEQETTEAERSYRAAWRSTYGVDTFIGTLHSEHNVVRYHPLRSVLVWGTRDSVPGQRAVAAASITNTPVTFTTDPQVAATALQSQRHERLRVLDSLPIDVCRAAHEHGVAVDAAPVLPFGTPELGHWMREQSISVTAHRHGRLTNNMRAAIEASSKRPG
jgi:RHH-type transcriptional regulator, proline utilization regulon repressor / proline dehydrogenase / delta 1-pyrroline-5-carboxylate dehydrogenase